MTIIIAVALLTQECCFLGGNAERTKRERKQFPPTHIQRWPFQLLWPETECLSWRSSVCINHIFQVRVLSFNSWERACNLFILAWFRNWAISLWLPPHAFSLPGRIVSKSPFKKYYSVIKKNAFESVLMRWMKLEPIIQSDVSQGKKTPIQYINAYIWNLERW